MVASVRLLSVTRAICNSKLSISLLTRNKSRWITEVIGGQGICLSQRCSAIQKRRCRSPTRYTWIQTIWPSQGYTSASFMGSAANDFKILNTDLSQLDLWHGYRIFIHFYAFSLPISHTDKDICMMSEHTRPGRWRWTYYATFLERIYKLISSPSNASGLSRLSPCFPACCVWRLLHFPSRLPNPLATLFS